MTLGPAANPCGSCPYRQDVPSGIWAAEEYQKLPQFDADMPYQPTGLFLCHQHDQGSENSRLCAGWVGCHGDDLLALRIAYATGSMSVRELIATTSYTTSVPLFKSGAEAAAHGMRDIEAPTDAAVRASAKISKRRTDLRAG